MRRVDIEVSEGLLKAFLLLPYSCRIVGGRINEYGNLAMRLEDDRFDDVVDGAVPLEQMVVRNQAPVVLERIGKYRME